MDARRSEEVLIGRRGGVGLSKCARFARGLGELGRGWLDENMGGVVHG